MNSLRRSTLVVACIVSLVVGATADGSWAESVTAKENLEKLIKTNSCRGCDLSGLTLNRMNLAGADLEGADFSRAKFNLSNLAGANLKNSNLKGATFGGSDLGEADLRGADLRGTSLDGAYLGGTRLDGEFVTAKPYEDIGVTDVEKQIYIDDPGKPKKNPETREVKVATRRDFEEPPPPIAVDQDVSKLPSQKNVSTGGKAVIEPANERQPDAPVAKKVAPVQQAIVEPDAKTDQDVAEPVASKESVKASGETNKENADNANSKTIVPKTAPKMMTDEGKPPVILHANSKKEISPMVKTKTTDVQTANPLQDKSVGGGGVGDKSKLLAKEKSKRDNLTRLLDKAQCLGCDLSGLDLSGKNLKNVDLEKADLSGCNLELVALDKANLKGAILHNANMRRASLKDADLYKADLSGADLTGADVKGAMFDNAKVSSAVGLAVPASTKK